MKKCPECSSEKIVPDVMHSTMEADVNVVVYGDPEAMIMKRAERSGVRVEVCGECGFIQLFAKGPKRLWLAYASRNSGVE